MFRADGQLTFFFHAYAAPGAEKLESHLYRLAISRDGVPYFRSDFASLRGTAQPLPNGMMMALQIPLSKLTPGFYQAQIEIALPEGVTRASRTASFEIR